MRKIVNTPNKQSCVRWLWLAVFLLCMTWNVGFASEQSIHAQVPINLDDYPSQTKIEDFQKAWQHLNWKPRTLPLAVAAEKMHKNAIKVVQEHRIECEDPDDVYFSVEEIPFLASPFIFQSPPTRLVTKCFKANAIGLRDSMEDADFFIETDHAFFAAVFDGHGGELVAHYAANQIRARFFPLLQKNNGNVHQTFEELLDTVDQEVLSLSLKGGTTAVICLIEKESNLVYTATLGDSEANIYRKSGKTVRSIPLSCMRNWGSPKEAARANICVEILNGRPNTIAMDWPNGCNSKYIRYCGINISRAIGDLSARFMGSDGVILAAISHKPKITVNQLFPGDILILTCDGLKDFVPEREIVNTIAKSINSNNTHLISSALVQGSLEKQNQLGFGDNVTVLTLPIRGQLSN